MEKHKVGCMVCREELVYSDEDKEVICIYCKDMYKSNISCGEVRKTELYKIIRGVCNNRKQHN